MSEVKNYRPLLVLAPGVLAGAEKVVLTGLQSLRDQGLNPLMIIIQETRSPHLALEFKKALPSGIESKMIISHRAFDHSLPKQLMEILKNEKQPFILHSHGFKALIACALGKKKSPHIHTHHGNTAHTWKVKLYETLALYTMKSCDRIIAVSARMKEELDKNLSPDKVVVVENMLSLSNASAVREKRKEHILEKHGVINLLFVGRLSLEKGLLDFLAAWENSVKKEHFYLHVVGDGDQKPLIEEFIRAHQLENFVTLHGFVTEPSRFFMEADLLIMPSHREGLPMTLIEALASGVPVLGSRVGALDSLIISHKNGLLLPSQNKDEWSRALDELPSQLSTWLDHAKEEAPLVEERFSAKKWGEKTKALYESIV